MTSAQLTAKLRRALEPDPLETGSTLANRLAAGARLRIKRGKRRRAIMVVGLSLATATATALVLLALGGVDDSGVRDVAVEQNGAPGPTLSTPAGVVKKKDKSYQRKPKNAPANAKAPTDSVDAAKEALRSKQAELAERERRLREGEEALREREKEEVERMLRRQLDRLKKSPDVRDPNKKEPVSFDVFAEPAHSAELFSRQCVDCHQPESNQLTRHCGGVNCSSDPSSLCCKWEQVRKGKEKRSEKPR